MTNKEELILVAEDSKVDKAFKPHKSNPKTIARITFEVLIENPYKYTEEELRIEVHVVRRKRKDLKLDSYNIKRSPLLQKYGWGIHRDQDGKLALISVNSDKYNNLKNTIKTVHSYRMRKI